MVQFSDFLPEKSPLKPFKSPLQIENQELQPTRQVIVDFLEADLTTAPMTSRKQSIKNRFI